MPDAAPHLNPPKQARSKRTLERIVRASLDILDEEGPDGLTVQAIVARAGSSVGSFYARFSGKDELLEYLGERVWREAAERWDEALSAQDWAGLEFQELAEGAVRLLGEVGRSRASYLRALEGAPRTRDDAYDAFRAHILHDIEVLLLQHADAMEHPDPIGATRLGLHAVLAVLDAPAPLDHPGLPPARRAQEATGLLLSYLTAGRLGTPSGDEGVDFFDIWG